MFEFFQKILPCFASPQQSEGVIVRDGFTTVPTPIKTVSAPPFQSAHSVATTTTSSSSIVPPKKPISPTQTKKPAESIPEHFNVVQPNVVEDEADYDEHWEDWKNTDADKPSAISFEEIATVVPVTSTNKIPEFNEIPSLPPITSLAPLSITKKQSPVAEKKEEEEKPAEPDVDWFSDMTPTYKPPPRLITAKLPTHSASAPVVAPKNVSPPTVNRLSLASLEMEQEEVDDEGWIEEPEEETVAPTRMSKLDAKNSKKKEKKAKKSRSNE